MTTLSTTTRNVLATLSHADDLHLLVQYYHTRFMDLETRFLHNDTALESCFRDFDRDWPTLIQLQEICASRISVDETAARLCVEFPDRCPHLFALRVPAIDRLKWIQLAISLADEFGHHDFCAFFWQYEADAAEELGQFDRALELREASRKLLQSIGDPRKEMGILLSNIAKLKARLGYIEEARDDLHSAIAFFQRVRDAANVAISRTSLGDTYFDAGELDIAASLYRQALKTFRRVRERRYEATTLANLANVLQCRGRFDEAREYLANALHLSRAIDDPAGVAFHLTQMAGVELERDNFLEAYDIALEANQCYGVVNSGDNECVVWNLEILGCALRGLDRNEESLATFEQMKHAAGLANNVTAMAEADSLIGLELSDRGEHDRALVLQDHAVSVLQQSVKPEPAILAMVLQNRAVALKGVDRAVDALADATRSLSIYKQIGSIATVKVSKWIEAEIGQPP